MYILLTIAISISTSFSLNALQKTSAVASYEAELDELEATMHQLKEYIKFAVVCNLYTDYHHPRVQELNARLGLIEFPASYNPFTHIGRFMDKSPSKAKKAKLRKEKYTLIKRQELAPYKEQYQAIKKSLMHALVQQEVCLLQATVSQHIKTPVLRRLKYLQLAQSDEYHQLMQQIEELERAIHQLTKVIDSLYDARAVLAQYSSYKTCIHCCEFKKTCATCYACIEHCTCCYIGNALAGLSTLSAMYTTNCTLHDLNKQLTELVHKKERLQRKITRCQQEVDGVWHQFLRTRVAAKQATLGSTDILSHERAVLLYSIKRAQKELARFGKNC